VRLGIARTLLFGWPAYLLVGLTGSERRGRSNHFWPIQPFDTELFPPRWHRRVWASAAGVAVVVGLLMGPDLGASRQPETESATFDAIDMVRRASRRKLASMPEVTNPIDRPVSGSAQDIWPPAPLCPNVPW
jgi:hypothetical protein